MQSEQERIKRRVLELTGRKVYGAPDVVEDTSSFFLINGGAVVRLQGRDYFVTGDASEGRFGIEDQPKHWVKYAVDLDTGCKKVLKLVFQEELAFQVGARTFPGKRSAQKEARVLRAVRGHPHFMQGFAAADTAGNLVRVIDFVDGPSVYRLLRELEMDHPAYFRRVLPALMGKLLEAFEAVAFLRQRGEHHGDIRNDHLLLERGTDRLVWIDFDYEMSDPDYDIVCLGNVLTCVLGKGNHYFKEYDRPADGPGPEGGARAPRLGPGDALMFYRHRIADLRKLFPYLPERMGRVLRRFSAGGFAPYPGVRALIEDVRDACRDLPPGPPAAGPQPPHPGP